MPPYIYTQKVTVKEFSHEFRTPRGLYLSYPDMDSMEDIFDNRTNNDIDPIVVTDGEGVLGIGDHELAVLIYHYTWFTQLAVGLTQTEPCQFS